MGNSGAKLEKLSILRPQGNIHEKGIIMDYADHYGVIGILKL